MFYGSASSILYNKKGREEKEKMRPRVESMGFPGSQSLSQDHNWLLNRMAVKTLSLFLFCFCFANPLVSGQLYPHGGIPDNFPVFKILIAVPIEKATIFSRDLQEAIGWWEGIHRNIGRPNWNNVYAPTGEELNPGSLQFSQIHVGNDTLRLFHSICDAVEKDTPSIILSLIDAKKTDYMRMIAESADVPLLTLSHDYMKEPQNVIRRISPNRQVRGQ